MLGGRLLAGFGCFVRRSRGLGLLQAGDKGIFQGVAGELLLQRGRGVAGEDLAGVHQRDAVAAFGLVHKVGGEKDGHALLARQFDQQPPEVIAGRRIDPGRGFVEDQHLRLMQHRHRQGQALTHAQGQLAGLLLSHLGEAEALHQRLAAGHAFGGR